jgi:hypothetical protein
MQKTVSVIGGDPELNKSLTADPSHNDRFVEWAQSVARESSLGSFTLMEIWILMRNSKELKHHAGMVKEAYKYIVGHPKPYQTAIVFDIQSDCKAISTCTNIGPADASCHRGRVQFAVA